MRVRLRTDGVDLDGVPDLTGRTAYRVVQEGLTNARKHAPATAVAVTVSGGRDDGLSVEVRNPLAVARNGDAGAGRRAPGLVGLVERTSLAGGRLEHGRTDARRLPAGGVAAVAMSTVPVRVALVDDDALVRSGLSMIFEGTDQVSVVAEAGDGQEALAAVDRARAGRGADGHPDARHGRAGRHRAAARPPAPARGHRADHLRRRRPRAARPAGGRQRLPAQGHPARRDRGRGEPRGGRRGHAVTRRDPRR